jgi:hypothetical protein
MPGTPASAPADAQIGRKAKITTLITIVICGGDHRHRDPVRRRCRSMTSTSSTGCTPPEN